jgi:hypothetical protein
VKVRDLGFVVRDKFKEPCEEGEEVRLIDMDLKLAHSLLSTSI